MHYHRCNAYRRVLKKLKKLWLKNPALVLLAVRLVELVLKVLFH